jgi:hypothetical protein
MLYLTTLPVLCMQTTLNCIVQSVLFQTASYYIQIYVALSLGLAFENEMLY